MATSSKSVKLAVSHLLTQTASFTYTHHPPTLGTQSIYDAVTSTVPVTSNSSVTYYVVNIPPTRLMMRDDDGMLMRTIAFYLDGVIDAQGHRG